MTVDTIGQRSSSVLALAATVQLSCRDRWTHGLTLYRDGLPLEHLGDGGSGADASAGQGTPWLTICHWARMYPHAS